MPRLLDQLVALRAVLEPSAAWEHARQTPAWQEPSDAFLAWWIDATGMEEVVPAPDGTANFAWWTLHVWRGWYAGYRYAREEV